jgi:hypothetical protein
MCARPDANRLASSSVTRLAQPIQISGMDLPNPLSGLANGFVQKE